MVGEGAAADASTASFCQYWENTAVLAGGVLVYNTGRSLGQFQELLESKAEALALPNALITAVGTKVCLTGCVRVCPHARVAVLASAGAHADPLALASWRQTCPHSPLQSMSMLWCPILSGAPSWCGGDLFMRYYNIYPLFPCCSPHAPARHAPLADTDSSVQACHVWVLMARTASCMRRSSGCRGMTGGAPRSCTGSRMWHGNSA